MAMVAPVVPLEHPQVLAEDQDHPGFREQTVGAVPAVAVVERAKPEQIVTVGQMPLEGQAATGSPAQ
jgi:hypothetical protein